MPVQTAWVLRFTQDDEVGVGVRVGWRFAHPTFNAYG